MIISGHKPSLCHMDDNGDYDATDYDNGDGRDYYECGSGGVMRYYYVHSASDSAAEN